MERCVTCYHRKDEHGLSADEHKFFISARWR